VEGRWMRARGPEPLDLVIFRGLSAPVERRRQPALCRSLRFGAMVAARSLRMAPGPTRSRPVMPSLSLLLPDLATLVPFLLASLALNLTPGADMAYVATRSVSQGAGAGVVSALGVS